MGETILKRDLDEDFGAIRIALKILNNKKGIPQITSHLASFKNSYEKKTSEYREKYGIEFTDLQKEYEEMLPEIKNYLSSE